MVHERVYYVAGLPCSTSLRHHGIQGMHWGIRRYQYEDGSLTPEGMIRYGKASKLQRDLNRLDAKIAIKTGDINEVVGKVNWVKNKGEKYSKKHPVRQRTEKENRVIEGYTEKLKRHRLDLERLEAEKDVLKKQKAGLTWAAIANGMDVQCKTIPRSTESLGKRAARASLATALALGVAYVNPSGFGFAYVRSSENVMGTKYRVGYDLENRDNVMTISADPEVRSIAKKAIQTRLT